MNATVDKVGRTGLTWLWLSAAIVALDQFTKILVVQRFELYERLELLPGLHLVADYRGGVSVRDRVTWGYTAAERILSVIGRPAPDVLNRPDRLAADTLASTRPAPTDTTA